MPLLLLFLLVSCKGCYGCFSFDLPDPEKPDHDESVDTNDDTAEDTADDTAETLPCATPEVEPNDREEEAQDIPMEAWACGTLLEKGDVETLRFENAEEGWIRLWARGAELGSNADLQIVLQDSTKEYSAINVAMPGSTDPQIVAPIPAGLTMYATIADQYFGYGENHEWDFIADMTKAPLDWDGTEGDDDPDDDENNNDALARGTLLSSGSRTWGTTSTSSDRDWFLVEVPEGESVLSLKIEAWNFGSPMHGYMALYSPGGEELIKERDHGAYSSDLDPAFEAKLSEAGTYGVLVKEDGGSGSPLYWYVLSMTLETEEPDTASD